MFVIWSHFRVSPGGAAKFSRGLAGAERIRTHRPRESSIGGTREKTDHFSLRQGSVAQNGTANDSPGVCGTRVNSGCDFRAHAKMLT